MLDRNISRGLVVLLSISLTCLARQYWNGSREGMSRAELENLFREPLKPYSFYGQVRAGIYTIERPQTLCDRNFQLTFGFDEIKPKKGLVWESLVLEKAENAQRKIDTCLLEQYSARYGRPKQSDDVYIFSRGRIQLSISPNRVEILYRGHGCRFWEFNCRTDFFN